MNAAAVERARAAGVLRAMPRRERVAGMDAPEVSLRVHEVALPEPVAARVLARGLRWLLAGGRTAVDVAADRLRGRRGTQHVAVRVRELFERMGGTAVKVGQQLAVRVDFLPFEVCVELGRLHDAVPPFPLAHAVERLEALTGSPIEHTFASLQPEVIGAASVACVWRGTLVDGRDVAVKVRRPRVAAAFVTDLTLLAWVTRAAEALTLVRPDYFKHLRSELRSMFLDELDFHKEATYQSMFRRYLRRDRIRNVRAPRVLHELSSTDVLTTEFVEAYSCGDVLAACETRDEAALAVLAAQGIDPAVVGRRIMQLSLWSRLECAFFHSDPHPGNILVEPGGRLVMLDFGACGINSSKHSEQQHEMMRRLTASDMSGGSAVSLSLLAPLPAVDVPALRESPEAHMWDFQIRVLSDDAAWWERTSAMIWSGMVEATTQFGVSVNLSVLRMTRASLLYDTLACRLDPNTNFRAAYKTWQEKAARRSRRRTRRRLSGLRPGDEQAQAVEQAVELTETLRKGSFWLSYLSREMPREFNYVSNLGSFAAAALLRLVLLAGLALVVVAGLAVALGPRFGTHVGLLEAAWLLAVHPAVQVTLVVLLLLRLNRLRRRLTEKQVDR